MSNLTLFMSIVSFGRNKKRRAPQMNKIFEGILLTTGENIPYDSLRDIVARCIEIKKEKPDLLRKLRYDAHLFLNADELFILTECNFLGCNRNVAGEKLSIHARQVIEALVSYNDATKKITFTNPIKDSSSWHYRQIQRLLLKNKKRKK